jgi:hypothetical protein
MRRAATAAIIVVVALTSSAPAQAPQFRWAPGQVLTYRVAQATTATETVGEQNHVTSTRLDLVKQWRVGSVDASGVATLSMSIARLRMETKTPAGETMLFDSADPAKSTPALCDEMAKFVNVPLTVVRLDSRGQLAEVKESKFGPASRLEWDLPFKIVLPTGPMIPGQAWDRKFTIKLDPPQGTGETYQAVQTLTCKGVAGSAATVGVTTTIANPPEAAADQIPLAPLQPTGDVVFDLASGRLKSVRFQIQKEVAGFQGEGSKYTFASTYSEELAEK